MNAPDPPVWMNIKPLIPPADPLLKRLHAPRQNSMLTELIVRLQVLRLRGNDRTVRKLMRR